MEKQQKQERQKKQPGSSQVLHLIGQNEREVTVSKDALHNVAYVSITILLIIVITV